MLARWSTSTDRVELNGYTAEMTGAGLVGQADPLVIETPDALREAP